MLPDAARRRVETLSASPDHVDQEVARRLRGQHQDQAGRGHGSSDTTEYPPSRWAHVDLADLLAFFGNTVQCLGDRLKSGHEPLHGSRSGSCLVAWTESGRWWCSSCHQSGDATSFVMAAFGTTYFNAATWLTERYGPPRGPARPSSVRQSLRRRVFRAGP